MRMFRGALLCLAAALVMGGELRQAMEEGPGASDNLMLDKRIAPARARVEALRKTLEGYRDHPSESDFTTIWVAAGRDDLGNRKAQMRRIPTEEFLARIERTEAELKEAERELKALERSLY